MIEIFASRKGGYYRLFVTGHANYNPGNDIVCAGVSALTGALLGFAQKSKACRHLRCYARQGEVFLACRGGLGSAFEAVLLALRGIADAYPQHVQIRALKGVEI